MKVSLKNAGVCRKTMTVEVPAEAVTEERTELLKVYARGVAIPGFRKGKAPKHLVEKKFAKEMTADLKDRLVPKFYHEAIEAEGVKVVSIINVSEPELAEGKPLSFDVTMDVEPEFKLPKYQGIPIKAEKVEVTEKQVDETIESILRQHATFEDISERPAKEKDMVQVSYESTIDGEPLETKVPEARGMGQGKGYWITCDDESFLPGMGKKLIGTSIGDKKDITVEFPAEFIVKELSGLKAEFKVEATGLRESKLPELDEEFLKKLRVESEEELRTNIRQHLTDAAEAKEKHRREDAICEFLLKKTKLEVPETAVQQQTRNVMYDMARQRMMQGMSQEQVSAQSADMMAEAQVKADEQVKLRYIMMAIAAAESLNAGAEEISEEITKMAIQQQRDSAEFRKELEKEGHMDDVADQIRFGKAVEFLIENAKIK
ncbi:MAG: trigger factor [Kiritimatiellales bacterium]|nr:trigger factor [Kiritimatiellota bacterium]MBL7011541.1 trigger factor [Kiritimatiellales bacterium]